jgi:hypothetical protein
MTIEDKERSKESKIYRTLRTVDKADSLEWIGFLRKIEREQGGTPEHRNPVYRIADILEDKAVNLTIIRGHRTVKTSVVDPCHFGRDMEPDRRIRTTDLWIRILHFSPVQCLTRCQQKII